MYRSRASNLAPRRETMVGTPLQAGIAAGRGTANDLDAPPVLPLSATSIGGRISVEPKENPRPRINFSPIPTEGSYVFHPARSTPPATLPSM